MISTSSAPRRDCTSAKPVAICALNLPRICRPPRLAECRAASEVLFTPDLNPYSYGSCWDAQPRRVDRVAQIGDKALGFHPREQTVVGRDRGPLVSVPYPAPQQACSCI